MISDRCPKPPSALRRGDELRRGTFWHNLADGALSKRYSNDDDAEPRFGWRLRAGKWRWRDDGLSTNIATCACGRCSTQFQSGKPHAVLIDLAGFGKLINVALVAQFDPLESPGLEGPDNPCHFLFVGEDESPEECEAKAKVAFETLDRRFPGGPGAKCPVDAALQATAGEIVASLAPVMDVRRHVSGGPCTGPFAK
jgi:hypothetical protein